MLQVGRSRVRVYWIFSWANLFSRTVALGSTQPQWEMSTRNLSGGKGRPAHKVDNLSVICGPIFYKIWELRRLKILWTSTACYRDGFIICCYKIKEYWMPFYSKFYYVPVYFVLNSVSLRCCPSLRTLFKPCSKVSQCSPRHAFWYHWNLLPNCDLEIIDGACSRCVHYRFEVRLKEIVTGREIRRTCRSWNLAVQ
jgi:hypothetical protein